MDFWGCGAGLPEFVCAGFAGSTWGCAPPGAATGPAAALCLLPPKYRGHSVQPQAVLSPRWHGDPRPPGTCSCHASLHLLGVFGVTSRGDAVGLWHVAVPPWCWWCHPSTLLLSPTCPPWTHSWFVRHRDAQGGVCISQPAFAASGLLALHPRVPLQALFCERWLRRGSERRGWAQPQGW